MIATAWTSARDVALTVLAVAVVALVRIVWQLQSRLTRLETIDDLRRRRERAGGQ